MPPSSAQIDLIMKDRQFQRVAGRVRSTMLKLRGGMEKLSRASRRVFLIGTAAISAVAFTAASFEKRMARVQAITSATASEMVQLTSAARTMGKETVFSANQAAEAMGFFAQAGFNVTKILKSLEPTLNLAAAGQLDIATAADLVTNIMSGMGIEVGKLEQTVDQLTKAFTSSNTNLNMLAQALKFVGPVAADAGLSLADAAAAIGKLSDAGLQATMAGTSLRMILLQLQDPAAEGKMRELGVAVRTTAGEMLPFTTILDNMRASLEKLDPRKQSELLGMFGARAGPALRVLLRTGGAELKRFAQAIENSGGVAKRVADIQLNTLHGSFLLLKSAAQEFALVLGDTLIPVLRDMTDMMKGFTESMNEMSKGTAESMAKLLLWVTGLAGAAFVLGSIGKVLATVVSGVIKLTAVLAAMRPAWLLTTSGFAGVAIGAFVVAAIAAFVTLDRVMGEHVAKFEKMLSKVKELGAKAGDAFALGKSGRDQERGALGIRDPLEFVNERAAGIQKQYDALRDRLETLKQQFVDMSDNAKEGLDLTAPLRDTERAIGRTIFQLKQMETKLKDIRREQERIVKESVTRDPGQFAESNAAARARAVAKEEARIEAGRKAGLDPLVTDKQLAARKEASKGLSDARRERLIQQGTLNRRDLLLQELRRAGIGQQQMARITSEIGKTDVAAQQRAPDDRDRERAASFGGVEGLVDTFRRIQSAATRSEPLQVAKQTLTASQKNVRLQEAGNTILRDLLDSIQNLNPGFGP